MDDDTASLSGSSRARILATFTYAGDIAVGLEFDDGIRACYLADRIAEELGLEGEERVAVYYAALLKDLGCTCWTTQEADLWQTDEIAARRELLFFGAARSPTSYLRWMRRYVGAELPFLARMGRVLTVLRETGPFFNEGYANAAEACVRITQRLGLPAPIQEAAGNLSEQWDGKGEPLHLRGTQIPIASRVVMPTFLLVPVSRLGGRDGATQLARQQRGKAFDPDVTDAFLRLAKDERFWEEFEGPSIFDATLAREPDPSSLPAAEGAIESMALALADFIDLKSPFTAAHSRRVAAITAQIARLVRCDEAQVSQFHTAALLHDLGSVAVPSFVLNARRPDTEQSHLHPYYGERILERIPEMASFMPLVGNHHEHMDGSGYFRGLSGEAIPLGARIICVANRLDELTHESPGAAALEPAEALRAISAEGRGRYDPAILAAVRACFDEVIPQPLRPPAWPAGLTDREVEVLRFAAKGLTRKQIGDALSISESTVRHHLEHIYNKTGTSTRVGATLFAMENNLIE
jgi:HD-GYP domain-containing protein (c-di-GMP phosphodiesterase class II)/DNA-binding CsgD family transcriptional regulator